MSERTPSPKTPELPDEISTFAPVPLRMHSKGWTPARQRAFIEALAETASVGQAAQIVNMSKVSCYKLRNHVQGGDFKRAWDAAIDFSVARLKDIAFERAVEGRLEPVWQAGKLVGHKRVYSDRMLMFLLRHYGVDENGRNVTVSYVKTKAAVAAREGEAASASGAEAEATTMTVRANRASIKSGSRQDQAAQLIDAFSGSTLDATAQQEIAATLASCAARQREVQDTFDDPEVASFTADKNTPLWVGSFEPPHGWVEDIEPFDPDEPSWRSIGDQRYMDAPDDQHDGETDA